MSKPQETKLKLKNRPRCTAVRNCPDPSFILCYPLGKRIVRICSKHLARWRRTGKLGPSVYGLGKVAPRAGRDRAARDEFRTTFSYMGDCPMRAMPDSAGLTNLCNERGCSVSFSTNRLWAFQRRGWISIGPWNARGSRSVRLTKAGDALIREGPSEDG